MGNQPGLHTSAVQCAVPQCETWAGIRPLEGITATPAPATTLPSALVYGGRIGSPSHLLSVQRDCSRHSMPLLCIIPDGMQVRDAHKLGPTCWWPNPPSGEGGAKSSEKGSRGRLILWTHTDIPTPLDENFSVPDWLFLWPLLFRDHPLTEADQLAAEFSRPAMLASMARTLRACPKGQWWWPEEEGALGQALHTGLWTSKHGNSVRESMPKKEGA